MELIDYGGVLRRWSVLIIAGTLVAALSGYRVALRNRPATHPHYTGTASVVVHYLTPPGVAYLPTLSMHTQTTVLGARATEPGALRRVAAGAHVALSQVQHVSTAVDAKKPLITVRVVGTTPRAVAAVAQGMAQYLAGVETQQVQAQVASLSRTAARAMAQAQQRWLAAQTHYYLVCGCIAGQHQATADAATLAQMRAELDLLRANYLSAAGRYTAVQSNPVPVATVTPGSVSWVQAAASSALKAVLLAAVLGLVVSSGLAALLDYRRHVPPGPARARGPVQGASPLPDPPFAGAKGESGSAHRAHAARTDPAPVATRTPGPARPLKAVLPAAGLGLLLCIGLAALLVDGRMGPLPATSHVGARHVGLAQRGRTQPAAQVAGPLAALPSPHALLLNPDAVSFDDQKDRTHRTAQTLYVVNVGAAPVTIRTITITGTDRGAFAEADTCTRRTVGVYDGCTISVRVAPMVGGGIRKATLVITANAANGPQRVPLSA